MLWVDQDVAVTITCTTPSGDYAHPGKVRFKTLAPSGATATYDTHDVVVDELEIGHVYRFTFNADEAGIWTVRSEALDFDDAVVGVAETRIVINASRFT